MRQIMLTAAALAVLTIATLAAPGAAGAHCDSVDGPVVTAAREALAAGDVDLVLAWVLPGDEAEIRAAFDRTMAVRDAGGEARELADRWFFETLVRVHRMGEGAPYTGLKPADYEPPAGIAAADRALEDGSVDELVERLSEHAADAVRERYERARALADHAPDDVEAGRAFVHAYVEYIHFVEELHALIEGGGAHAATPGASTH